MSKCDFSIWSSLTINYYVLQGEITGKNKYVFPELIKRLFMYWNVVNQIYYWLLFKWKYPNWWDHEIVFTYVSVYHFSADWRQFEHELSVYEIQHRNIGWRRNIYESDWITLCIYIHHQ